MVGGSREAFERVEPVLASMTKERVYLGPSESGAVMKLAMNGLLAVINQGMSEALVLAERAGSVQARPVPGLGGAGHVHHRTDAEGS